MTSELEKMRLIRTEFWKHKENGELERAIQCFEEKVQTSNLYDSVDAALFGEMMREAGRSIEAIPVLEAAETSAALIDHERIFLWIQLGFCYRETGEVKKAVDYFLKAAKEKPDKNIFTVLAQCQLKLDPTEAAKSAKRALDFDSEWEEARQVLHDLSRDEKGNGEGKGDAADAAHY